MSDCAPSQPSELARSVAGRSSSPSHCSPFRLPATIGRCPDCGGPLDCSIDGGDERGHTVMLTCFYECDGPGLQCDWQPILDAARRYVNTANEKGQR